MRMRHLMVLALLSIGWILGACSSSEVVPSDLAARVAGREITWNELREWMARHLGDEAAEAAVSTRLLDQYVDEILLERLALDRGLGEEKVGDGRAVLGFLLGDGQVASTAEAEARAYFESHRERWARPERVRVRQILVEKREVAEEAREALLAGTPFADVAENLSEEPLAHLGGDQGLLSRDDLPPLFADILFDLEPEAVSSIVPVEYGFHIFQVVEKRPAEELPFEEVQKEIVDLLDRRRIDAELERLVALARESYNVKVYRANLPFDYQGSYPTDEIES